MKLATMRRSTFLWMAIVGVLLIFCFVAGSYILKFGLDGRGRQEEWAQFGDYFGGVLGPFLGFITIIGVLLTYELQRRQLKLTQRELIQQAKLAMETARLSALTAALEATNVMIETPNSNARLAIDAATAEKRREAIIREIFMIADIDHSTYM